ncbi:thioesterase II family protein [Nocardiopsis sp. FIRDI 009]|uniref:thioesterase II family protein n=1 Tax=Nocardiopsis sp. FIRDI 009 TaxID=714197 RepID=UPI000E253C8D|nr:alpha/beta fold hydrolase [Nocardiopsis sp. FIRDI 009]
MRSDRPTLYCLAYAGGTASTVYAPWKDRLADVADVVPLDIPGRGAAAPRPVPSVEDLVSGLVDTVLDDLDGPWGVLGHSFGGGLAVEIARAAELLGRGPLCCFVSGRRPPGSPRTRVGRSRPRSDDALLDQVAAWGGVPPEFLANPGLRRLAADRLRRDIEFSDRLHRLGDRSPLDCALHVLTGRSDPLATPEEARGWATHTTGRVTFDEFDGDHFFVLTDGLVPATIAARLRSHATTREVPV